MQNRPEKDSADIKPGIFAAEQPEQISSVTDTPEFRNAVAAAKDEIRVQILADLASMRKEAGPESSSSRISGPAETSWSEQLAMAIANISDQGTSRKRVAPEILKAREDARVLMMQRIRDARANGDTCSYQVRSKIYLGEQLIEPMFTSADHIARPTEIDWGGIPNEAMRPTTPAAQGIYDAFMASIGSSEKVVEEGPLHVTPGGVVVHGRGPARRQAPEPAPISSGEGDGGVRVKHRDTPGQYIETKILGTVAQPARQTV